MEAYLSRINFSNRSTTRAWTVSKMIANVWSDIVGTSKKIRYSFVFARARWKQMTMYIPRIDDESVFAHLFRGDTCPIFQHVNVRKYPRIFVKTFHTNFFLEMRIETRRIIDVPSIHVSFTIAILSNNSAFIAVFRYRLYPFFIASHAKIVTLSSPIFSN